MNRVLVSPLAALATLALHAAAARAEPPVDDLQVVPPEPDPSFQVNTGLSGRRYSISDSPGVPDTSGSQEALSMTVIAYGTPLHDDESPYSLQPFMQREDTFSMSLSGGHFDTANPYGGGVDRTEWSTGLGASFNTYLKRWLAVFGGASYGYFDLRDAGAAQTTQNFSASLGVGVRVRDTRFDLSVAESGNRTAGAFAPWRNSLTLSVVTVIRRRVSLTATGTLAQGGGEGFFQAVVHPSKKTGVFASAFAGRYEPYSEPVVSTRYVGGAGFSGWFDATTALEAEYSVTYEKDPATPMVTNGYNELAHTVVIEADFRFQ